MKLQRVDYEEIIKDYRHVKNSANGDFIIRPFESSSVLVSKGLKKLPDWGLVQISITLPLGHGTYCDKEGNNVSEILWETPMGEERREERRYKGIGLFETLGSKSSKGLQQIYYTHSKTRFGSDIAVAMGAEPQGKENCLSSYVWLSPVSLYNNSEDEVTDVERCRFELDSEEDVAGIPSIELASFELLQYRDQVTSTGGYQRYLVLHFIASDCTSVQLEKISQSLTKPRNKCVGKNGEEFSVGKDSIEFIQEKLNGGISGSYHFEFAPGGFLQKSPKAHQCNDIQRELAAVKVRNSSYPKPARSVCAIPNIPLEKISYIPKVFEKFSSEATDESTKGLLWAAQLSRGCDEHSEEIPTLDILQANLPVDFQLKNWNLLVEDSGIVAVRNTPELSEDPNITTLAPTRYVDLLLLVQRSYSSLRILSEQLRNIGTQTSTLGAFNSDEEQHSYNSELRRQFNQLLRVQNQFSALRKTLWFNAIPRRQLDTLLMLQLRKETGVQNLYDDLVDEVQFRHRIHDLTYHEFDADLKDKERKRREQEDEERRKRQDEEDERREEIARSQEKFATILSIVGFIAIPLPLLNDGLAFVQEMRGAENPLWLQTLNFLWIGVVAVLGLILLTFLIYKILKKTRFLEIFDISPYDPRQYQKSQRRNSQ